MLVLCCVTLFVWTQANRQEGCSVSVTSEKSGGTNNNGGKNGDTKMPEPAEKSRSTRGSDGSDTDSPHDATESDSQGSNKTDKVSVRGCVCGVFV